MENRSSLLARCTRCARQLRSDDVRFISVDSLRFICTIDEPCTSPRAQNEALCTDSVSLLFCSLVCVTLIVTNIDRHDIREIERSTCRHIFFVFSIEGSAIALWTRESYEKGEKRCRSIWTSRKTRGDLDRDRKFCIQFSTSRQCEVYFFK